MEWQTVNQSDVPPEAKSTRIPIQVDAHTGGFLFLTTDRYSPIKVDIPQ
jgi:hypothetical protein